MLRRDIFWLFYCKTQNLKDVQTSNRHYTLKVETENSGGNPPHLTGWGSNSSWCFRLVMNSALRPVSAFMRNTRAAPVSAGRCPALTNPLACPSPGAISSVPERSFCNTVREHFPCPLRFDELLVQVHERWEETAKHLAQLVLIDVACRHAAPSWPAKLRHNSRSSVVRRAQTTTMTQETEFVS